MGQVLSLQRVFTPIPCLPGCSPIPLAQSHMAPQWDLLCSRTGLLINAPQLPWDWLPYAEHLEKKQGHNLGAASSWDDPGAGVHHPLPYRAHQSPA